MLRFDSLPPRGWFALMVLAVVALLAGGMVIQSLYRISACPLCVFQRLLYLLIGALALGGALLPRAARLWAGALLLVAAGGVATAGYQTWMQIFPHLANECSYSDPNLIERLMDWLGMQWPWMFLATGFCASRDWEMFGLSIANWSLVAFSGFAVVALLLLKRRDH